MAEKIVSPGVFTRENDLSFVNQGIAQIGAAIVAPFPKGPAFVPTTIETQADFQAIYGIPDGKHLGSYTVEDYLRQNGRVTVVRVGSTGGYAQSASLAIRFATNGNTAQTVAVLAGTLGNGSLGGFTGTTITTGSGATYATSKTAVLSLTGSGLTSTDYSFSFDPQSTQYIKTVFGSDPLSTTSNAYNYVLFEDVLNQYRGDGQVTASIAVLANSAMDFTQDVTYASTPWVVSQRVQNAGSNSRYNLFRFHTISDGDDMNRSVKVAVDTVRVAGSVQGSDYGSFNVSIRKYSDTDSRPVVLESFQGVNLDPTSPNFIGRVIGDRQVTVNSSGKISETGDYNNNSRYVRVEVKNEEDYPITAVPAGFAAMNLPVNDSSLPAVAMSTGSLVSPYTNYSGFDFTKSDNVNYLKPVPDNAGVGNNVSFSFEDTLNLELTGSTQTSTDLLKRRFIMGFQGGFDGMSAIVKKNTGTAITATNTLGLDCSTSTATGTVAYTKALNAISNPDEFDINLLVTPGIIRSLHPAVTTKAITVCEDRGDCFYIADLVGANDTVDTVITQAAQVNSSFAGAYYPWVKINDITTNKIISVPPSAVLPGVFAFNDKVAYEWWAPAGFNRGGISAATSVHKRLDFSDKDNLATGKVNPIASFPGEGVVVWGQKTLQDKASALDRISVRRLLIALKKFIASTSRYLVFEQNTLATQRTFLSVVEPYLDQVVARQGLYAYRVQMDDSNNTPDIIDRNILQGTIWIQPSKTAEFIVLDFNVLPTGASFSS